MFDRNGIVVKHPARVATESYKRTPLRISLHDGTACNVNNRIQITIDKSYTGTDRTVRVAIG